MPELGIIITNRDRPQPLRQCLRSLTAQVSPPAWVVISDLGSSASAASELEALARDYSVSYLQIAYAGTWNQALAFNTALRRMPPVTHVVQLDVDMILHPYLLAFTQCGLKSVDALCCVPSYISAHHVPDDYDGSWRMFRQMLSVAYGGNRLSRGGYVVLPRDWLIANGGYDETYCGWGFEDADLWWRAGQQLTTYAEESGSLLLHQSHVRQSGARALESTPNRRRYELREAGLSLPVNPAGFGQAPIEKAAIRLGIRRSNSLPKVGSTEGFGLGGVGLRTRQQGRLRPAEKQPETPVLERGSLAKPARSSYVLQRGKNDANYAVSVVVLLVDSPPGVLAASLDALAVQTHPPYQILVGDYGNFPARTNEFLQIAQQRPECDYITIPPDKSAGKALRNVLKFIHHQCAYVLAISRPAIFHPTMLEFLLSLQDRDSCFVHGRVHAVPSMACELSSLGSCPWEAWGSIAHLEPQSPDWWFFGPQDWIQRDDGCTEMVRFAEENNCATPRQLGSFRSVVVSNDLVLCYSCQPRAEILD